MIPMIIILGLAAVLGFYMAWNIGANDVANAMSTAVGARAITLKQAVIIAAVLDAVGAIFIGAHVTGTVSKGIVSVIGLNEIQILAGFMAALLSASIFITIATWFEMPVSTTHGIVGAMVGFGLIAGGIDVVHWDVFGKIVLSWILSPIFGAITSFIVFKLIVKAIFNSDDPDKAAVRYSPVVFFMTILIIALSLLLKTNLGRSLNIADNIIYTIEISIVISVIGALIGYGLLKGITIRKNRGKYFGVEAIFRRLQVMTSCYVALAHGANDVANAVGPLIGILLVAQTGTLPPEAEVPFYILVFGGIAIAIGIMTWGYKVMRTLGHRITELTNTRGFSVDFGAATTVLIASKLGMPISTTHTVVGALVGVGLARGIACVDLRVIKNIVISWLITVPVAALVTMGLYLILFNIFI